MHFRFYVADLFSTASAFAPARRDTQANRAGQLRPELYVHDPSVGGGGSFLARSQKGWLSCVSQYGRSRLGTIRLMSYAIETVYARDWRGLSADRKSSY